MEAAEHFVGGGYYGCVADDFPQKPPEQMQFTVDDLLNFSNEDSAMIGDGFCDNAVANSAESSSFNSCNSSLSGGDSYFSNSLGSRNLGDASFSADLCVPNDDVAELEWLSNFVEDSFSNNAHNLQLQYPAMNLVYGSKSLMSDPPQPDPHSHTGSTAHHSHSFAEAPLPSKSRSRRSRAAPCDWTTRLLHLSPSKPSKSSPGPAGTDDAHTEQVSRRCLHCAAEKTPQWRTGPMGPKTLCNACGVRYKSGRLVPEYRPAASPTFVSTKHSNSHRKVLELRRQKELHRVVQAQQQLLCHRPIIGVPNGRDDCLIGHCNGPNYGHLI